MYKIKIIYSKKSKLKSIYYDFDTDSYDDAMQMFQDYLIKHRIKEEQILNYEVVKVIKCSNCGETVTLKSTKNICKCGTAYDFLGKILEKDLMV